MDYDKTTIAATYDAARGIRPEEMRRMLDLVAAHAPATPRLIVDVGCGTGRFTYPLAERFQSTVIGIDPSEKMLEAARAKGAGSGVEFRQASAEQLPLPDGCADVVFMSMMLHHLSDRAFAARECRRVLSPQGRICVRNSTRDSLYPQRQFFPSLQAIIDRELPSRDEVVALFEGAGLRLEAYQLARYLVAANWQQLADKLALRADSFLVRLPMQEFEAGIAALRIHATQSNPGEGVTEHIHFFVFGR